MATKKVVVLPGDDAAPEAVLPALNVLRALELNIEYIEFPPGEEWVPETRAQVIAAIDSSDSTLFGATSGRTAGIGYLRWKKESYANVRPVLFRPGYRSPLKNPEGLDFVIVRENLEDLYVGVEGPLRALEAAQLSTRTGKRLDTSDEQAVMAIKIISERNTRRIAEFSCRLALARKAAGGKGKVTCSSKYNMLPLTDGLFRKIVEETVSHYPDLKYEQFIVDDFARRLIQTPHDLDVVVLPNLYGDILSDAGAGLIGGLGVVPSGCYGESYAYFEPVHGTAPDIKGRGIINPTATLLSAAMMLEYLGFGPAARRLNQAIDRVYAAGKTLTPDQGGSATSVEFCRALADNLP